MCFFNLMLEYTKNMRGIGKKQSFGSTPDRHLSSAGSLTLQPRTFPASTSTPREALPAPREQLEITPRHAREETSLIFHE